MNETQGGKTPIIRIEGLTKSFNGQIVLDGIDLDIFEGETIVILGASGSGKTVLLNLLAGLLEPDSGSVFINGEEVTAFTSDSQWDKLRLKLGFLFQGAALYDSMTIAENISFAMEQHLDLADEKIIEIVRQKLRAVELEGTEEKLPAELSGGMQKRAALARAISLDPRIIIYDEPTTGLDPILAKNISELIVRLQRELCVTSIVVTHDLICASVIADRLALLYNGKFLFIGTMEELRSREDEYIREFLEASSLRR
ncbi:MAG: ATP-binding cassette domain-containing protein [Candidatus Lindowbacteria bacterium]|nr:ATP-binding cassette domain-containing protein [Candidatus Lindowbacteria bacterium]